MPHAPQGHCHKRFAALAQAFAANFTARGELGAACCLIHNGETVADLWGGHRDATRAQPWTEDTLVNVWSSTKGVNAAAFAMLVDRGVITYETPVATVWPEFGAAGKERVTLAQLLSHQAGLPGFTEPATIADLYAASAAARLAAQAPLWPPGSACGYHAISIGILCAELARRLTGRALRAIFAEDIARPLGLDLHLGLPPAERHRAAEIVAQPSLRSSAPAQLSQAQRAALANPPLDPELPNTASWQAAELSSANGFANARALAGLYARLLPQAHDPLVSATTLAEATATRAEGRDLVLDLPARWGAGFLLNPDGLYGPSPSAFGHSGWGGSFAFADPENGLAFAYTMNLMGPLLRGDPRAQALITAVYEGVG